MLGFIDLFKEMRRCKVMRKRWKIDWRVLTSYIDKSNYFFYLIPCIRIKPWTRRDKNGPVIILSWLNVHFGIFAWRRRPKEDFKNV